MAASQCGHSLSKTRSGETSPHRGALPTTNTTGQATSSATLSWISRRGSGARHRCHSASPRATSPIGRPPSTHADTTTTTQPTQPPERGEPSRPRRTGPRRRRPGRAERAGRPMAGAGADLPPRANARPTHRAIATHDTTSATLEPLCGVNWMSTV